MKLNRKLRRERDRLLKKAILSGKINPIPEEEGALKDSLQSMLKAVTVSEENPVVSMTVQCDTKGSIEISPNNTEDERCSEESCFVCRQYDVETGVVDRHLLTEEQKLERDALALERQKELDPEGYRKFKRDEAREEIEVVDFEEIKDDEQEK